MKKQLVILFTLLFTQLASANFIQVNLIDNDLNTRTILSDSNGMTLYTFDVDSEGQSNCHGQCLITWPAFTTDKEKLPEPFNIHIRNDGSKQVTLNGEPLYFFIGDQKVGDINGNGLGGVWHIIGF